MLTEYTEIPPEAAQKIQLPSWKPELTTDTIEKLSELSKKYGYIEEEPDLDSLIRKCRADEARCRAGRADPSRRRMRRRRIGAGHRRRRDHQAQGAGDGRGALRIRGLRDQEGHVRQAEARHRAVADAGRGRDDPRAGQRRHPGGRLQRRLAAARRVQGPADPGDRARHRRAARGLEGLRRDRRRQGLRHDRTSRTSRARRSRSTRSTTSPRSSSRPRSRSRASTRSRSSSSRCRSRRWPPGWRRDRSTPRSRSSRS